MSSAVRLWSELVMFLAANISPTNLSFSCEIQLLIIDEQTCFDLFCLFLRTEVNCVLWSDQNWWFQF